MNKLLLSMCLLLFLGGCQQKTPQTINQNIPPKGEPQETIVSQIEEQPPLTIKINRAKREMTILGAKNEEIMKVPIGIGRGGLKQKKDMMDLVTPTGEMEVDLILYQDENFSQVAPQIKEQYAQSEFKRFFENQGGLKQLFENMNQIDFNGNGSPDRSYGIAYIGLNSTPNQNVITGPKMRYANWQGGNNIPYWFSIALHGTPNENQDLGSANSGGCIHVSAPVLREMIEKELIQIGTKVVITDS